MRKTLNESALIRLLSSYTKNNVVSLSVLKKEEISFFEYILSNYKLVVRQLKNNGITILNDLRHLNNLRKVKLFLLYFYSENVDIIVLQKKDHRVYRYLYSLAKAKANEFIDFIESLGFNVIFNRYETEESIRGELYRIADGRWNVKKIEDSRLYSRLSYRAKKNNTTIRELVESLGFSYKGE